MKKKVVVILACLVLIIFVFWVISKCYGEKTVTNKDYLYSKVEDYIKELNKKNKSDDMDDFNTFIEINEFGIKQKGNQIYVYAWILAENYYVKDGELESTGSSMPYRFIVENDNIIDYEIPKDGSEYTKSIKRIFPKDIREMIYNVDSEKNNASIRSKVEEHYSYLFDEN